MVPPTAALSSENVMDELAVPPSTMLVAADRLTAEGPSTTVSTFVVTLMELRSGTQRRTPREWGH